MTTLTLSALLNALDTLHSEVDRIALGLSQPGGATLRCGPGCHACCIDHLRVSVLEAERIRRDYPEVLASTPAPEGACAFLDADGRCRVYSARPQVCRTQGLPLQWTETTSEVDVHYRDICPLNGEVVDLASLPDQACWPIGFVEERLALLAHHGEKAGLLRSDERVALRSLFVPAQGTPPSTGT